ncbi:hypothetical protein IWW38_004768 [Coemansia aciculifera]|uniref:Uncharacterized protein n=1 Tax=Coemansia aciculifera TaxID=417176 RepID=A0ACC1LY12_9FUNG|nr:hypothetical protein IWW38_004768 [Coemansia aciculifera]
MVKAVDGFQAPYTALRTDDLESATFLDSIVPGLSSYKDGCLVLPPEIVASELSEVLEQFDRGIRCIYKESEEAEDCDIDKEGWGPGVLEKVLWERRKSSAERRKWERKAQGKRHCGNMIYSISDISSESRSGSNDEEDDSASDASDSSSESSSSSDDSSTSSGSVVVARPTSVNKALGSDNVGFKMLEKLGWQQGRGLGAAEDGIVEPIRLATRFSTVRGRGRGRGRARGVARASLGTGRRPQPPPPAEEFTENADLSDDFESYRKKMSTVYKQGGSSSLDKP